MTISYAGEVPNGSSFGCFWKILWKWRGSVYKLVWRELLAYLLLYYTINLLHRFVLSEHQQKVFNKIRIYFAKQGESIPMSFVLGFYVNLVVKRWWEQYRLLPWPDTLALFISAAIPNSNGGVNNETGRLMRRNIMRYMVLAYVITLQRISLRVKRRFPSTQHLVDAGLMHESEMKIFDALNQRSPMSKYWMPLVWATNIINRARKEGLIASDHIVQTILVELSDIRRRLGGLIGYDTVCVPLVYTQVVTLVLYTYFIAALLGRQMLPNSIDLNGKEDPDLYFPLFTVLQFVFYVGWLKVAEVLINPFGEDDDDIELNWLIDRHIKAAYMIVDEMHEEHPELLRDQYWECVVPKDLPYTVASEHYRRNEPKGSAENYKVKKEDAMYANIISPMGKRGLADDVYADYESVDTPMVERRKNNWLVRQLSRMGSIRSQATSYSSGGMAYNRNRINSVYSSPESGLPLSIIQQQQQQMQQQGQQTTQIPLQHHNQQQQQQQQQIHHQQSKPSLYEKFVQRKSLRAQKQLMKQNSRLNGFSGNPPKPRPRIPTPDVTKEIGEKDSNGKAPINAPNQNQNQISYVAPHFDTTKTTNAHMDTAQAVLMAPSQSSTSKNSAQLSHNAIFPYPSQDQTSSLPTTSQVFGTLLLSPIKEMDCSSANNTLIPGHATTTALAQAILPANRKDGVGFNVNSSIPPTSTTNITTFSFPFAVTTTSADTLSSGATLNIVPIGTTQIPTIATSSTGLIDVNSEMIALPVPLSIQRSSSPISLNELSEQPEDLHSGDNSISSIKSRHDGATMTMTPASVSATAATATATIPTTISTQTATTLLPVKSLNFNRDGISIDRSASLRSADHHHTLTYDDTNTLQHQHQHQHQQQQQQQQQIDRVDGKTNGITVNSTSAPSTLSKHSPESKTGEVYV